MPRLGKATKPPPRQTARRPALVLAAILLATCAAYANSFEAGFVLDSRALILENPILRTASAENALYIATHDYWQPLASGGLYRPLTSLSYLADFAVLGHGARPAGYHALNLLLHLGCVACAYALLWQLTDRAWPTAVGAAVFALHPVASEAVTNIVGRADLLAALGVLAGLLCHARALDSDGRARLAWRVGLAAAATVAAFSKESGLVLLPLLALYDAVAPRASGPTSDGSQWRSYAAVIPAIAVYLALRWYAQRSSLPVEAISPIDNPLVEGGFWTARLTALKVVGLGLGLLFWPVHLSADYSYAQVSLMTWPPSRWLDVAAVLAPGAVALALLRLFRRDRAGMFLVGFYAVALLPTANLLILVGSVMAERFLYLPLFAFAGIAGLVAEQLAGPIAGPRRSAVSLAVAAVLLALGVRTAVRNRDWTDERTLWGATVVAAPDSAKAHRAHAKALFDADPSGGSLEAVLAEAERAVEIRGDYGGALVDLGGYYVVRGDGAAPPEAAAWYGKAVAVLEAARRQEAEARVRFAAAMQARGEGAPPHGDPLLYNNLSLAYGRLQRFEEALAAYEELRRLQPDAPGTYVDLSAILANLGRFDDATVALWQALALSPQNAEAAARLVPMYRAAEANRTAVTTDGAGNARVDLADARVRRHRCLAYRGLAEIYAQAQMPAGADRARAAASEVCP